MYIQTYIHNTKTKIQEIEDFHKMAHLQRIDMYICMYVCMYVQAEPSITKILLVKI